MCGGHHGDTTLQYSASRIILIAPLFVLCKSVKPASAISVEIFFLELINSASFIDLIAKKAVYTSICVAIRGLKRSAVQSIFITVPVNNYLGVLSCDE